MKKNKVAIINGGLLVASLLLFSFLMFLILGNDDKKSDLSVANVSLQCIKDSECGSGMECNTSGSCVKSPYPGSLCRNDNDCAGLNTASYGIACRNNRCSRVEFEGTYCATNDSCASGLSCVSNKCVKSAAVKSCTKNSDCGSAGYCDSSKKCATFGALNEACADRSTVYANDLTNGGCQTGLSCQNYNGRDVCRPAIADGSKCYFNPSTSAVGGCGEGSFCNIPQGTAVKNVNGLIEGTCKRKIGLNDTTSCLTGLDMNVCVSGTTCDISGSNYGKCVPILQLNATCGASVKGACDTDAGLYCDKTSNTCKLTGSVTGCTSDLNCQRGYSCQSGSCKYVGALSGPGAPCANLSQCAANLSCVSGKCVGNLAEGASCNAALSYCGNGLNCVNSKCSRPRALNESCDGVNTLCASGYSCVSGLCKLPNTSNNSNPVLYPSTNTPSNTICTTDLNCSSLEKDGNKYACINKLCVKKKNNGEACTTTAECVTGNVCSGLRCKKQLTQGSICNNLTTQVCGTGLQCIGSICLKPKQLGETCMGQSVNDCALGLTCDSSTKKCKQLIGVTYL